MPVGQYWKGVLSSAPQFWKGILGFLTPGAVALTVAVTAGSDGGTSITRTEAVGAIAAMVITGGVVTAKRNGTSNDPTTSTPEV